MFMEMFMILFVFCQGNKSSDSTVYNVLEFPVSEIFVNNWAILIFVSFPPRCRERSF